MNNDNKTNNTNINSINTKDQDMKLNKRRSLNINLGLNKNNSNNSNNENDDVVNKSKINKCNTLKTKAAAIQNPSSNSKHLNLIQNNIYHPSMKSGNKENNDITFEINRKNNIMENTNGFEYKNTSKFEVYDTKSESKISFFERKKLTDRSNSLRKK